MENALQLYCLLLCDGLKILCVTKKICLSSYKRGGWIYYLENKFV